MNKYNIYCDESCHLEHDREKVMVIGGTKCSQTERKNMQGNCGDKKRFGIPELAKIKWNKKQKTPLA